MKTLLALALSACALFAQANPITAPAGLTLTVTGPASVSAGDLSDNLTISISGTSGINVSDFQFTLQLPAGVTIPVVPINLDPAMQALGKALFQQGNQFIVAGLFNGVTSNTPITDGVVATIPISIANNVTGPISITFAGLMAADVAGTFLPMSNGPVLSLPVTPSACDANGDGQVTYADALQVAEATIGVVINGSPVACGLKAGCNVSTLVQVIGAAMGQACTIPHN